MTKPGAKAAENLRETHAEEETTSVANLGPEQRKTQTLKTILGKAKAFSPDPWKRVVYTNAAIVLGLASGILLSPKLWINTRFYPVIPVIHGLPRIAYPLDYILAAGMFLLLALSGLAPKPRKYILGCTALLFVLALLDQTRWQPWLFLYVFMFVAMGCFSWQQRDDQGQENALNICRLIIAGTYFYSGLQKMNPRFALTGIPSMLGSLGDHLPLLHIWGWVAACVELSIGIGLLTRKYRNFAVVCGLLMHLFILFTFSIVMNWNTVVWPWNVAMMAFLVLLFWNTGFSFGDVLWRNSFVYQKVVLVLFAILPALSFFGWWDSDLSASLYSANLPEANIRVTPAVESQLPEYVRRYVEVVPGGHSFLKVQDWSFGELNVPPYAATRTYRKIGSAVCRYTNNSPDIVLLIQEKDTLLGKGPLLRDTCFGTLVVDKW